MLLAAVPLLIILSSMVRRSGRIRSVNGIAPELIGEAITIVSLGKITTLDTRVLEGAADLRVEALGAS